MNGFFHSFPFAKGGLSRRRGFEFVNRFIKRNAIVLDEHGIVVLIVARRGKVAPPAALDHRRTRNGQLLEPY